MTDIQPNKAAPKKNNPLQEIIFNILIPSLILMKLSGPEYLGTVVGLLVALAFPVGYAIYDFSKVKTLNFISVLGFVSTLLTGSIALLELDVEWLAIKEVAIPAVISMVVLLSGVFGNPLLAKIMLNSVIFNLDTIYDTLEQKGNTELFRW